MNKKAKTHKERLGDLLIKANLIDDVQLRVALTAQKDSGERLGTTLVELGFVDEAVLAAFLSKQMDMPCINISNIHIPKDIIGLIPKKNALEDGVVPIRVAGNVLYLAMADPFDKEILARVNDVIPDNLSVTPMIAPEVSLKKCLVRHYEPEKLAMNEQLADIMGLAEEIESDQIRHLADTVEGLTAKVTELTGIVYQMYEILTKQNADK